MARNVRLCVLQIDKKTSIDQKNQIKIFSCLRASSWKKQKQICSRLHLIIYSSARRAACCLSRVALRVMLQTWFGIRPWTLWCLRSLLLPSSLLVPPPVSTPPPRYLPCILYFYRAQGSALVCNKLFYHTTICCCIVKLIEFHRILNFAFYLSV